MSPSFYRSCVLGAVLLILWVSGTPGQAAEPEGDWFAQRAICRDTEGAPFTVEIARESDSVAIRIQGNRILTLFYTRTCGVAHSFTTHFERSKQEVDYELLQAPIILGRFDLFGKTTKNGPTEIRFGGPQSRKLATSVFDLSTYIWFINPYGARPDFWTLSYTSRPIPTLSVPVQWGLVSGPQRECLLLFEKRPSKIVSESPASRVLSTWVEPLPLPRFDWVPYNYPQFDFLEE